MYILIDNNNKRICCEWCYLMEHNQRHICWKTQSQLKNCGSYHDDFTIPKLFNSYQNAINFILKYLPYGEYIIIADNWMQRLYNKIKYHLNKQNYFIVYKYQYQIFSKMLN